MMSDSILDKLTKMGQLLVRLTAAQAVLKEEERKESAREAVAEAVSDPDVATPPGTLSGMLPFQQVFFGLGKDING